MCNVRNNKTNEVKKMICKLKKAQGSLTEWERRKISEEMRNIFLAYNLEYVIITRK